RMKPLTAIALASSISLLAACGGDGSSFGQMVTRNQVLSGETAAPPTQVMPTAGTATYRGVASFDLTDDFDGPDIMSDAEPTADFASSTLSGNSTHLRAAQANGMTGQR